jgi:hypothetical protein
LTGERLSSESYSTRVTEDLARSAPHFKYPRAHGSAASRFTELERWHAGGRRRFPTASARAAAQAFLAARTPAKTFPRWTSNICATWPRDSTPGEGRATLPAHWGWVTE